MGDLVERLLKYAPWVTKPTVAEIMAEAADAIEALTAERDRLKAELAGAREALGKVIDACDRGRTIPKNGACGMTIEAQIRASCINGVDAWPIEEARETFYALATQENTDAA
jgi:hypothetical protein